jgi:hypothetical protein
VVAVTHSAVTPLFVPTATAAIDRVVTTHHRRLPLASVPSPRPSDAAIYGMTAMDDRGRIVVRTVLKALGWLPGTPTRIDVKHDVAVITEGTDCSCSLTAQGHLRLPAAVRHRLGLRTGDRLLLVGTAADASLIVYPPTALDTLLAGCDSDRSEQPT